ncbi:uncharacterized protein N7487_000011 [Penicillium crustosum]|uniref:uncharacterized protein n=1 Tax=Penicillium crustosum TaxID=36656 RepID=UPI00238D44E6|nr:uncharacterized protein N7487_000011 [Penicillium crustosum]KAJ5416461.1 hypothetical protein N7487_000011 [Penicillium crustosum]
MPSSMLTRKSVQESKQLKGGSLRCGSDAKSLLALIGYYLATVAIGYAVDLLPDIEECTGAGDIRLRQ